MYKIIIADDDEILLRGLSNNLDWEGLGITIVAAVDNGVKAFQAVKENNPDILLTDVCMPEMDGIELINNVKQFNPDISTVIFSAHDEFSYVHKAIKQGAEDYLLKPIDLEYLSSLMIKIINGKENQKEINRKIKIFSTFENEKENTIKRSFYSDALLGKLNKVPSRDTDNGCLPGDNLHAFNVIILKTIKKNISDIQEIIKKYQERDLFFLQFQGKTLLLGMAETVTQLKGNLSDLKKEILSDFPNTSEFIPLGFANGNIVSTIYSLQESYQTACKAAELFFIDTEQPDIYISDFKAEKVQENKYFENLSYNLAHAALLGNFNAVKDYLTYYERSIVDCGPKAKVVFTYTLSMIFSELERSAESMDIHLENLIGSSTDILNQMFSSEIFSKSNEILKDKLLLLAAGLNQKNDKSAEQKVLNALKFIKENYKDSELRISKVCTEVGLSKSYFSIVFKASTGESFTDYLTQLRISKAKELLYNTNYRSYEVSYMVGYNNPTYFSSTFKKLTGFTPSEFARKNQK